MPRPDPPPPPPRVQLNVRLPEDLRDAVDARRSEIPNGKGGLGISRDLWMERALRAVLSKPRVPPEAQATATADGIRTAPPPRHRT